jgi:riboflavin synthase
MFTGIVEEIGVVRDAGRDHLSFEAPTVFEGVRLGDSIAVNGVCLTVVSLGDHCFSVDVMPETLRSSNLGRLHPGHQVNLERALILGGRLGGHLVLGHIDGTGRIVDVGSEEGARLVRIAPPPDLMVYVVSKGFIAVDGVSLTIADFDDYSFVVSLVAYTARGTTLGGKRSGEIVNLETDIIGKYVQRLKSQTTRTLDLELLEQYGFAGRVDGS